MAVSTQPKSDVYGKLTIIDGSDIPLELVLAYDLGDFSISDLRAVLNEVVAVQRRGQHVGVVHGARVYPTISFSSILMSLTHAATPGSVEEMILKRGAYAASKGQGAVGTPRLLGLKWTVEGSLFGDEGDIEVFMSGVDLVLSLSEGQPTTVSISGTIYGAVTGDLAAAGIVAA